MIAGILALLFFAWPMRTALFDPGQVSLGVDLGSVQLPWSAVIPPAAEGTARPQNPALWDPGIGFYPLFRWMVERWDRGETVRWNPLIFTGAPALGNPQQGVLDPQNWLLGLGWKLGGLRAFHWTLGATAWLRFALAGLGAYLLARRLGLLPSASALAGIAFALSGYQVVWLNFALGHVTPFLPWILLGLEGTRGNRPLLAASLSALAMALSVVGGHPETTFFVGAAAGIWALHILQSDRRAGALGLFGLALGSALSACAWQPFLEYLDASTAQAERSIVLTSGGVDLIALGVVVVMIGVFAYTRRELAKASNRAFSSVALLIAALVVSASAGFWILSGRGLSAGLPVQLLHDFFGSPGDGRGGYRGPGVVMEVTSGWIASGAFVLALAAALSVRTALARRGVVLGIGLVSLSLCLELPGLHDVFRQLPVVGLGQPARMGTVSALMLALLAADGLSAATRSARVAAVVLFLTGLVASYSMGGLEPLERVPSTQSDQLVGHLCLPEAELANKPPYIEGWFAKELEVEKARLVIEQLDQSGRVVPGTESSIPFEIATEPSDRAQLSAKVALASVPDGARFFRTQYLLVDRFDEGHWLLSVELLGAGEPSRNLGRRVIRAVSVTRPPASSSVTLILVGLGLGLVLWLPTGSALAFLLVLVVALQGLWFAEGKNPTVPEAEVYPATRTVKILQRELGDYRFFAEPGVMPADTAVTFGLRCVDGYDGLRPYLYNTFKNYAVKPGIHKLLGWNARGVDLNGNVFRLLGVSMLVLKSPLHEAGWELIAAPVKSLGVEVAETWIYRATDPMPRAFCVNRVTTIDALAKNLATWDPSQVASIEAAWRPGDPFETAEVTELVFTPEKVSMRVRLDGDGLLVLTDGAFPGWVAEVNGDRREVLNANMAFRSVPLSAGDHEVAFIYESEATRNGFVMTGVAAVVFVLLVLAGLFGRGQRRQQAEAA
ncbi:MAG: hypothetical protein ACI8TQ_000824 [Planctomycetota bacterium]